MVPDVVSVGRAELRSAKLDAAALTLDAQETALRRPHRKWRPAFGHAARLRKDRVARPAAPDLSRCTAPPHVCRMARGCVKTASL